MTDPTFTLTQTQISAYHRDGFLSIERITSPDEIERLQVIYDRLFERKAGRDVGDQFDLAGSDEDDAEAKLPQILRPSKYAPELAETQFRNNGLAMARQLLGEEATFRGDHAIMKPPSVGVPTPWHQDEAYWEPDQEYNSISIWVPLQEATPQNGCMVFLPGPTDQEVFPHHPIGNDPRVHGLEADEFDDSTAVECPLPMGGATIHHCRTMHYTGPNLSSGPRRAYIMVFGVEPKPRAKPRDFYWQTQRQTAREARKAASESRDGTDMM